MITTDIVQEVFNETIFPDLKNYVETNSLYAPLVIKSKPQVSDRFPIIAIKLLPSTNQYNNLSYSEETFSFGIEIDINAQDKVVSNKKISKRTICEELTSWIIEYLKTNYRVTIANEPNAISTDTTIHRALIRVSGKIDTKYGEDNLVIYPR